MNEVIINKLKKTRKELKEHESICEMLGLTIQLEKTKEMIAVIDEVIEIIKTVIKEDSGVQ